MRVIVLGAGVVGVATAWYLRELGHEVVVLDRQAVPAAETSFANGGQISVSHAEPWANPAAPLKILKWLGRRDAPLIFRPRADLRQWEWGLRFLLECTPARTHRNIDSIVRLGVYSRTLLRDLRRETGIAYDHRAQGILHFYTNHREFEDALEPARRMREAGCERDVVTPDEAVRIEPALRHIRPRLVGATYTSQDESGDANRFTRELARLATARGVTFLLSHTIVALRPGERGTIDHVEATDAEGRFVRVRGEAYVLALGPMSPLMVAPLGLRLPVYPAKGYSVTMPVQDAALAHEVSLTDDEHKLVFSRFGERLRIAGFAELTGYDRGIDAARCAAILRRAEEIFPGAGDASRAQFWAGLRPSTPGNVPLVGRTRFHNLYLNTGHGTLGWTHACGSGNSIARILSGLPPEVDFAFTRP